MMLFRGLTAFLFGALVASSSMASAPLQPAIHFDRANLVDGIYAIYGDVLKDSYSIDSELLKSDKLISLHLVAQRDPAKLRALVEAYLRTIGVVIQKRGDVLHFMSAAKLDKEAGFKSMVYRSRFRSVSYLADFLPVVFPKLRFSFRRGVSMPASSASDQDLASSMEAKGVVQPPPVDSGTSAYSQIDRESDIFVVQGDEADFKRLRSFLAQIDVPESQVVVNAYLYEVSGGANKERGFSASVSLFGRLGLSVGEPVSSPTGGQAVTISGGSIQAVLSSLNGDSNYKLLSSPSLRVRDGGKGRFSVGSDVPVLGAVQQDRQGNPVQSVEYKPSGVILDVSPRILQDVVSLHIQQQESSFVKTTTGVNNSPTLLKREMQTDLVLKPGDVVVMGSLNQSKDTASHSGQSWLPSWAHSSSSEKSRSEVLLVMSVDVMKAE